METQIEGRLRRFSLSIGGVELISVGGVILIFLFVFLLTLPLWAGTYNTRLVTRLAIAAILALGVNILQGWAGTWFFGPVAFYAVAVYSYGVLMAKFGLDFIVAFLLAFPVSLAINGLVGLGFLRLRLHGYALVSFAFVVTVSAAIINIDFLGGEDGIRIPPSTVMGHTLGPIDNYYVGLAFVVLAYAICRRLRTTRFGRAVRAQAGDKVAARSCGVNPVKYLYQAWLLNAALYVFAAFLFVQNQGYITPTTFDMSMDVLIIIMIVVGGIGSNIGAIAGGVFMTLLMEYLNPLGGYNTDIALGIVLIVVMLVVPSGFIGLRPWLERIAQKIEKVVEKKWSSSRNMAKVEFARK